MNLNEQLAALYVTVGDSNPQGIINRISNLVLSRGISTVSRLTSIPKVDGLTFGGLFTMLDRELSRKGYRTVLYDSNFMLVSRYNDIQGHIRIRQSQRLFNISSTLSRQATSDLLRIKPLRRMMRADRSPGIYRAVLNSDKGRVEEQLTELGAITHPRSWEAAYPFLVGPNLAEVADPAEYWRQWSASSCNLTLLIGDPGTGKSSWMRGLMDARGYRRRIPRVVDDMETLGHASFNGYLNEAGDEALIVIEDADLYVAKREDGNSKMSALLNTLAGISGLKVKFLISTNLSSLRSVDPALYRPGRAFRVMTFSKLSHAQALAARAAYGLPKVEMVESNYTLAEALNYEGLKSTANGIGYV